MTPTVGRIVHFYAGSQNPDGNPFAAIVTDVKFSGGLYILDLVTFGQGSIYFHSNVLPLAAGYGWTWPPKV